MKRISYGIIVICRRSQRTLIIQRKDSPDYLHFIRGFFRRSDIPVILSRCVITEHNLISQMCHADYLQRDLLIKEALTNIYGQRKAEELFPIASKRIGQDIRYIQDALHTVVPKNECEWLWPKGGRNHEESIVDCAIRETHEETGLLIHSDDIIHDVEPIIIDTITFFGFLYQAHYFIAIVDEEHSTNDLIFDTHEVSRVKWIDITDIGKFNHEYERYINQLKMYL